MASTTALIFECADEEVRELDRQTTKAPPHQSSGRDEVRAKSHRITTSRSNCILGNAGNRQSKGKDTLTLGTFNTPNSSADSNRDRESSFVSSSRSFNSPCVQLTRTRSPSRGYEAC